MSERKYLHTLGDLVDRLSIVQLKEVFIPEFKQEYSKEIADIVHDIQLILNELCFGYVLPKSLSWQF